VFEEDDVTEVQILRYDHVVPLQGRRALPLDLGFSSDEAVGRAVRRLCIAAGKPVLEGEPFVERRLARGARLFAMLPGSPGPRTDSGHVVVLRKPTRADASLEELVRSGTVSRAMATFLGHCVSARASILIAGPRGGGAPLLLGALASAGNPDDRVVTLTRDDEIVLDHPHAVSILLGETAEDGARAVRAAAQLAPDRLVVAAFGGRVAADVSDAMGDGVDGVIAAAQAPSLRQAVLRLTSDIAAARPGLSPEVAREQLVSMFDVVIEIARLRDGRLRVLRVGELDVEGGRAVVRDLFTFTVERTAAGGSVEGTFAPTELVPRVAVDFEARGVTVDSALFRRHVKGDSGDDLGARPPPKAPGRS
jgi:pilus assembly protein CpaF